MTDARDHDELEAIVRAFHPSSFDQRRETLSALDPHFAATWVSHVGRLLRRNGLDRRRRLLVLAGQYTMRGESEFLRETLGAGLDAGVDPRELLEAILQCYVYAGQGRVAQAAEVFRAVADERGVMADVQDRQPPMDVTVAGRDLGQEQGSWAASDRNDPRVSALVERYGWAGISTGLRLRPGHHINLLATLDMVDPDFLQIWLDTIYQSLYSRRVLDDATRLLCVVGDCFAVGETHQSRRHMRGALRQGVRGRELLEVIFQSCAIVGHPHMLPLAVDDLLTILDDEGRLGEVVEPEHEAHLREIVQARVARRDGVRDLGHVDPATGQ